MYVNLQVLSKFIRWRYAVTNIEKGLIACRVIHLKFP